tara:strand:- start:401 stop:859 length:459 start_codon:yes stop_codon:yes gene_type:complete
VTPTKPVQYSYTGKRFILLKEPPPFSYFPIYRLVATAISFYLQEPWKVRGNTPTKRYKMERAKVGTVTVDSGTVIIADPCYLKDVKNDEEIQVEVGRAIDEGNAGNANLFTHWGEAVASRTAFGDGRFSVFVEYREDGRPGKLIIDFEGDME